MDFGTGTIEDLTTRETIQGQPFAAIQKEIYLRGGLLEKGTHGGNLSKVDKR